MQPTWSWLIDQLRRVAAGRRSSGALADEVLDRIDATIAALDAAPDGTLADPEQAAIEALTDVFDLDEVEVAVVLIAAAADAHPGLLSAMLLLDGAGATRPSVGLTLELCGLPWTSAAGRARLAPGGALRRTGLVRVEGGADPFPLRSVRCPDLVVAHLLGDRTPSVTATALAGRAVPIDSPSTRRLAGALIGGARLCWLRSGLGNTGAAVAAGAFERLGLSTLVVDLRSLAAVGSAEEVIPDLLLEAGLHRCGVVMLGADALAPTSGPARFDLLTDAAVPVVAVGRGSWNPGWSVQIPFQLDAPRLTPEQREVLWRDILSDTGSELGNQLRPGRTAEPETAAADDGPGAGWDELVAMRLTPEEMARSVQEAGLLAGVEGRSIDVDTLQTAARHLATAGRRPPPETRPATFDDLVLPPDALNSLHRIVNWARHRDTVLAESAVTGPGGKGSGITALFAGGPGTGKTLAAHVLANALGLDMYPVDLSSIVDKYIGETEKNLERVFHEAESMNVVLFFDEADSLFGSRSAVNDARDRYANLEVSYLLQRMEQFDGIAILATNLRGNIDTAFSRRLHFIVTFVDPDADTRGRLWRAHLSRVGSLATDDPVDVDQLATDLELCGGDIRNIVMAATYDAAAAGLPVGMRHVVAATEREYIKLGRRVPPTFTAAAAPVPLHPNGTSTTRTPRRAAARRRSSSTD